MVNFYGTLAQINAERILPVFEKRFPGIKVNHVDATADKLAARAITEARGGRVFSDVFQMALENVLQVIDQKLVLDWLPPEAAAYPANLKGANWLAADMVIITASWNTNLVKKEDEPKQFDDFADPKWKGKLIAEAADVELLIGLAPHKYKNDEKAFRFYSQGGGQQCRISQGPFRARRIPRRRPSRRLLDLLRAPLSAANQKRRAARIYAHRRHRHDHRRCVGQRRSPSQRGPAVLPLVRQ